MTSVQSVDDADDWESLVFVLLGRGGSFDIRHMGIPVSLASPPQVCSLE